MIKISEDRFVHAGRPDGAGDRLSLAEAGLREGEHLREYIARSPEVFFPELGQDLLVIGTEVPLAEGRFRADILAVDRDGAIVVIELKRNADRHQHLQALGYAAHLWTSERLKEGLGPAAALLRSQAAQEQLASFLRTPPESLNSKQRILLVAEDYYLTTLRTVLYLAEVHAVDFTLCRIALHEYPEGRYLACELVSPADELQEAAISLELTNDSPRNGSASAGAGPAPAGRGPRGRNLSPRDAETLATVIAAWNDPALAAFVEAHAAATRPTNVGVVFFLRANGHGIRFALDRRNGSAGRVLQSQRFTGDVEYWRKRLPAVKLREKERKMGTGRNPLQWNLPDQAALAEFLRGLSELPQEI